MLTIMLPEIVTGDKVVYNNEHEGVVTNIESPLGYQQFTVELLNGLTRICARYQIAKIDNYFSENGPTDDEWMDIISAFLLPEGRPLSSVSEPTVGDWDAMNNEITDEEAVGALPSDEEWHAIDIALSEPLAMCPNQETPTSAPTPVFTAMKSIPSAGHELSTNVTLAPSTSSRRKKTVSFADPISFFIVAQTIRGSKASTPRIRAGRVALDIMTVQHDEPQPHTSGTGQRFTEPQPSTSGTGQRFTEPQPHTSGTGQRFTEPRSSTSGTGQRFTEPRSSTSGTGQRLTEPRSSTSGTGQRFTEPQPRTSGTGQRFTEPRSSTSGTGQRFTEPQPRTSGTGQRFTEPRSSISGTGQRFTEPQPSTSGTGQRVTEPQTSTSGTGQRFTDVSRADVTNFILDHENSNTAYKTKGHVNLLKIFNLQSDDNRDIHDIPPVELNAYLARFFLSVRSKNGSEYEPSTLRGMLGSFIRHLNRKSYNVSLLDDVRFSSMRESLKSKQKQLKKMGKGNRPMRAEPLKHTELAKLYESQQLGLSTPSSLLNTLWFNNCTHFGLRGGKQEHRGLCWGDVTLKHDSDGREYLELRERQTKTRTGEDIRNVREVAPRAWENGENPERCPVAAYKLFRSKRPKKYCGAEDPFYIAPVPTNPFPSSSEHWFISQPVGVNKLCSIMSNMCRAASVSEDKRLTNHSARKFLVQTLTGARIADRDIMQVTRHKNVQSIRNYSHITEEDHRGISNLLCGNSSKPSAAANFPVTSTSRAGAQRPSASASQLPTPQSQLPTPQSQLPTQWSQLPTQQSQLRNQLPGQNVM